MQTHRKVEPLMSETAIEAIRKIKKLFLYETAYCTGRCKHIGKVEPLMSDTAIGETMNLTFCRRSVARLQRLHNCMWVD